MDIIINGVRHTYSGANGLGKHWIGREEVIRMAGLDKACAHVMYSSVSDGRAKKNRVMLGGMALRVDVWNEYMVTRRA